MGATKIPAPKPKKDTEEYEVFFHSDQIVSFFVFVFVFRFGYELMMSSFCTFTDVIHFHFTHDRVQEQTKSTEKKEDQARTLIICCLCTCVFCVFFFQVVLN